MGLVGRTFSGIKKVMIFIDGGYLRKQVKEQFGNDLLNYSSLASNLTQKSLYGDLHPQLIRAFYYDAMPDLEDLEVYQNDALKHAIATDMISDKMNELRPYFQKIRLTEFFDVRLGRLMPVAIGDDLQDKKKWIFRQKGVDTLIAIDMITKAFQNQYDEAILVAGDRDFVSVVETVKHIGPIVTGAFFEGHISDQLKREFDRREILTKELIQSCKHNL